MPIWCVPTVVPKVRKAMWSLKKVAPLSRTILS
jgi:hypothetical protein